MAGKNGQKLTTDDFCNAFLDILRTFESIDEATREEKKNRMRKIAVDLQLSTTEIMKLQQSVRDRYQAEKEQSNEGKRT